MSNQAIGIFDSGIGGLTVMRQIGALLPHEDILYFGDTARVPYGNRSPETIRRYALECALFLMEKKIKLLVIACNTAASWATDFVRERLSIPVVEVITPAINHALETTRTGRIAVIGTRATIGSGVYQRGLKTQKPTAEVFTAPCPLLVPFIEEQLFNHPATRAILKDYIAPLSELKPDTFILGCTHYPLLLPLFQEILESDVRIIDPGISCAQAVQEKLNQLNLAKPGSQKGSSHFFVSDDAEKFKRAGEYFFEGPLSQVELV